MPGTGGGKIWIAWTQHADGIDHDDKLNGRFVAPLALAWRKAR
jgi:hypothetical protein